MLGEYYILKYSPNTTRLIRGRCVDCVHCVQGIDPKKVEWDEDEINHRAFIAK